MQEKIAVATNILLSQDVPHLPEAVIKLQDELQVKYPNTSTIAGLINSDPEILTDFLSLANSNLTEEKSKIGSAKAAVDALGLDEIFNIFVASAICNIISGSYGEKLILKHGRKAGIAAAELSYWVPGVTRSEAYMAGLLQNIGAIYLTRHDEENYPDIFKAQQGKPFTEFESETNIYQTNHIILTMLISKKWNIDSDIYKAILYHHDPKFSEKTAGHPKIKHLTALIMIGDFVVSSLESEQYMTTELKKSKELAMQALDLPDTAIKAAKAAVAKYA